MSIVSDLVEKPADLSVASQYTAVNGIFYLASGAVMLVWPGVIQTVFLDSGFAGHEEALCRVLGMMIAIVGWLYLFGGRSGARQFVAASVFDGVTLVPLVLIPLALAGVFPHVMTTFGILDPSLGIGAWLFLGRQS
jgi:hypothetical protein